MTLLIRMNTELTSRRSPQLNWLMPSYEMHVREGT